MCSAPPSAPPLFSLGFVLTGLWLSQTFVHSQPRLWGQVVPVAESQREVLEGRRGDEEGAVLSLYYAFLSACTDPTSHPLRSPSLSHPSRIPLDLEQDS